AIRAAAVRVIDRVHRDAADRRTDAAPAIRAGLADRAQAVLFVADFDDRCPALDVHATDLAGTQAHLGVGAFAGQQARGGTRRAGELRALAGQHLDAVDGRTDRDVPDRQRVARTNRGLGAAHQGGARGHAARRQDVATLAVRVQQQGQVRAAVRVVLDALDLGRDAVLVATEVHDPVVRLVAATAVTRGDVTQVVAPG